jgi:hypothetical protein
MWLTSMLLLLHGASLLLLHVAAATPPQPPRRAPPIPFVHRDVHDANGWRETIPSFVLDPTNRLQLLLMRKRGDAPVVNNTPHGRYGYSVHCTSCELVTARASADGRSWPQPTVALLLPADAADAAAAKRGIISAVGWFSRSGATVAVAPDRRQIHLFMAKFINSSALGRPDAHEGALATMYSRGDWDPLALHWNYSRPKQVLRDDDNGSPLNALVLPSGRVLFAHAASPGEPLPKGIIYDRQIYTVFSDDSGTSWHRSAAWPIPNARGGGLCEPSLLLRQSGELWMPMRSQILHTLWQSRSADGGGNSWSAPQPTGSAGGGLPLFVSHRSHMIPLQLRDGRLVVFWPNGLTTNETYPTRQMSHAALSTDAGLSFSGYREVAREVFSNQGTDETGPDHGAGGATRPVETGVDGRLLVAAGQGAHTQLLYTLDVDWLLQRRQTVDFARVASIADAASFDGSFVSTEGTTGVELANLSVTSEVASTATVPVQALRLRRAATSNNQTAAVWNFPAAEAGELRLTVLWATADAGLSLALSDFFSAPADAAMDIANSSCIFQLQPSMTNTKMSRNDQPVIGQWHSIRVRWSLRGARGGGFRCTMQLDDGPPATAAWPTQRPGTEGQLSYVRLRATGGAGSTLYIRNMSSGGHARAKTDDDNVIAVRCPDMNNCTTALQAALDDTACRRIVLPYVGTMYQTLPLTLRRSDVRLELEAGVVLQAIRGAFRPLSDPTAPLMLLTISGVANVSIVGGAGSGLRMWRVDYCNSSMYAHSEDRMGLAVYSSRNVLIEGLEISETGGDGVLLVGVQDTYIKNVTTDGAYRNGLSIVGARNLLVEDCVFGNSGSKGKYNGGETLNSATGGTAPRAGVDIEPDTASQIMVNITLRRVTVFGSSDDAFDVSAGKAFAEPVDVTFDDCTARDCSGSWGSGWAFNSLASAGSVTLRNSRVTNCPGAALLIRSGAAHQGPGTRLLLDGFEASNVGHVWNPTAQYSQGFYPITVTASAPLRNQIRLRNCSLRDIGAGVPTESRVVHPVGRPFFGCQNQTGVVGFHTVPCAALTGMAGTVTVYAHNKSVCSTALLARGLGTASANLTVKCVHVLAVKVERPAKTADESGTRMVGFDAPAEKTNDRATVTPAAARARPSSPVELTVYGLRPANLSTTLDNRNTGDASHGRLCRSTRSLAAINVLHGHFLGIYTVILLSLLSFSAKMTVPPMARRRGRRPVLLPHGPLRRALRLPRHERDLVGLPGAAHAGPRLRLHEDGAGG